MPSSDILTAQYVHIRQTPASVWDRFLARLIDTLVQIIYIAGMIELYPMVSRFLNSQASALLAFLLFLPLLLYDLLWETLADGQSIGKRIMHLRVVSADGGMPTLGSYLLRWMLMLVEGPALGCVGLVPMLLSRRTQRFGDMVAGTVVIKLMGHKSMDVGLEEFSYLTPDYRPTYPQAADLTARQADIISRTLEPMSAQREQRVELLAEKVAHAMGIGQPKGSAERFLYTVLHDYQYYDLNDV